MACEEQQELSGIAFIGGDGVIGQTALACQPVQPGLALGQKRLVRHQENLVHSGLALGFKTTMARIG